MLVGDPLWDNRYDPSYPNAAALQAEDDEFEGAARAAGLDLRISGRFPRLLVDLGLGDVGSAINCCVHRGGDLRSRFIHASIPGSSEAIDYDALYEGGTEQVANILLDPDLFYIGWHHLAVWGTRPLTLPQGRCNPRIADGVERHTPSNRRSRVLGQRSSFGDYRLPPPGRSGHSVRRPSVGRDRSIGQQWGVVRRTLVFVVRCSVVRLDMRYRAWTGDCSNR